jgi:hypothetical protein
MKIRFAVLLFFALSAQAAPMVRVVGVKGPSTIVVLRDNVESEVALTGIEITDPQNAAAFLRWSLASSWVMIENGQVYRSPDAMLINAELVKKGFARSTAGIDNVRNGVYLGELDLGPRDKTASRAPAKAPAPRAKAARPSPLPRFVIRSRTTRAPRR